MLWYHYESSFNSIILEREYNWMVAFKESLGMFLEAISLHKANFGWISKICKFKLCVKQNAASVQLVGYILTIIFTRVTFEIFNLILLLICILFLFIFKLTF